MQLDLLFLSEIIPLQSRKCEMLSLLFPLTGTHVLMHKSHLASLLAVPLTVGFI